MKDVELRDAMERIVLEFPGYGYRRVTATLRRKGWSVSIKLASKRAGKRFRPSLYFRVFAICKGVLRVGLPGLEPGTSSLSEKRSNRLSYRPVNDTTERTAEIGYNTGARLTT